MSTERETPHTHFWTQRDGESVCLHCGSVWGDDDYHEFAAAPPASDAAGGMSDRLSDERSALEYATRLFRDLAPQCEPCPDLMGVLTQLDNAIVGLKEVHSPEPPLTAHANVGKRECVECQECLFTYSSEHADEHHTYFCPVCESAALHAEVTRLRAGGDDASRIRAALTDEHIVRHPNGHLIVERSEPYTPGRADTEQWLASLSKAWPYLADHAQHIDGEFDLAHGNLKRGVEAFHEYVDRVRALLSSPSIPEERARAE